MREILMHIKRRQEEHDKRKQDRALAFAYKQSRDAQLIRAYKGREALLPDELRSQLNLGHRMDHRLDTTVH